jgi:hypothetical protein
MLKLSDFSISSLRLLLRRERQREPELHALRPAGMAVVAAIEEREVPRHHPDDGVRPARPVEPDRLADGSGVAAVQPLPQPVTEHDLLLVANLPLGVGEGAPQRRGHAQHAEQRRRDPHAADFLGDAVDGQRVVPEREQALLLERRQGAEPVEVRGHVVRQDVVRRDGGIHVAHPDDAVGLGHRQRPQQDGVDDGEDGGVRAETEAEGEDDGGGEPGLPDELAEARADVAGQAGGRARTEPCQHAAHRALGQRSPRRVGEAEDGGLGVDQFLAERGPVRDLPLQVPPRLVVGPPGGAKLVVDLLELGGPLVDDLVLAPRRQPEPGDLAADERPEITHIRAPRPAGPPR